jgi:hypothetical protein
MEYVIIESFKGEIQDCYGPFPSQDQMMSYMDWLIESYPRLSFESTRLLTPRFMPDKIHD